MRAIRGAKSHRSRIGGRNGARPGRYRGFQQPDAQYPDLGSVGQAEPGCESGRTLNGGEYTVFAPTNAAFDKLPAATIDQLKTDAKLLSSILTYHVIAGQASPSRIDGTHQTLQGADLTVIGARDDLMVNNAGLVCGGVHTANATVYMIDTVLMPPAQ